MKRLIWLVIIIVVVSSMAGCARARRIANDIDWILLDAQPNREN